ncbi:predicted GPI-anchored protein 58, partial [Cajanus cajan]|uniref:predicted GPI-anchored protein 58 n=1 Tax=Cajanus cajan TaxID=3821 RepID=UPI00098D8BE5
MGRSKWRELKSRYNVAEIEVPEPQVEEISPLETRRKRKRGEKEVGGTSTPRDAEEVTSKAADSNAVDLTRSPLPEGAPQVAAEEVVQASKARPGPNAAEARVAPSLEVPGPNAPAAGRAASSPTPTKVHREGPSSEVPTPTPAATAPSSRPSKGAPRSKYLAQRFEKDCPLSCLDH